MRALAIILAASAALAGCTMPGVQLGDTGNATAPVEQQPPWTAAPIACPDWASIEPPPAESAEVAAPRWSPGDWWNYTVLDAAGRALGYVLREVRSCVLVEGSVAYRLRETALTWGEPRFDVETARERTFDLDATTMNEVWARCSEIGEGYYVRPCQGRSRAWDFPLQDKKEWSHLCCGDLLVESPFAAERAGADMWLIHQKAEGAIVSTWTYTPSAQAFTRFVARDTGMVGGGLGAAWELRDRGTGGAPHAPLSFESSLRYAAECLHPEARGAVRDAPALPAWRASGQGTIVRLADALGQTLVGEPVIRDGRVSWNATNGTFEAWERTPDGAAGAAWRGEGARFARMTEAQAGAFVQRMLQRFSYEEAPGLVISSEARRGDGVYVYYGQEVGGERLAEIGGGVSFRPDSYEVHLGVLHVLPANATVNETQADAVARPYMDCAMREMGRNEETGYRFVATYASGLAVREDSLVRAVMVTYTEPEPHTHCGERWMVFVDANTAAVVGHGTPICF